MVKQLIYQDLNKDKGIKQLPDNSQLYSKEPKWFSNRPGLHHLIPATAKSWIYEPDSLTRRLRCCYGDALSVKILHQQWGSPFLSERTLLGLKHNQFSLIREVLLFVDQTPLILARTIMPAHTLKGAQRILSRLGNRPLGEIIFAYPKLQRIEMDISLVEPKTWSAAIRKEFYISQEIWGRRTVYSIKHRQMLVSEFFLQGALNIA